MKLHYIDEKHYHPGLDKTHFYTACGLLVGIYAGKIELEKDEVMSSSIFHTQDETEVTCKNCQNSMQAE